LHLPDQTRSQAHPSRGFSRASFARLGGLRDQRQPRKWRGVRSNAATCSKRTPPSSDRCTPRSSAAHSSPRRRPWAALADEAVPGFLRDALLELIEEIRSLEAKAESVRTSLATLARRMPVAQRLLTVPGIIPEEQLHQAIKPLLVWRGKARGQGHAFSDVWRKRHLPC